MLEPRKVKYRRIHKPVMKESRREQKVLVPRNGSYGLKVLESGRLTARELESARRVIAKRMKKKGNLWVLVFPDKPVTSKPAEVRMGKGKGSFDHWVALVKGGRMIFEIDSENLSREVAYNVLKLAGLRLSLKTKIVENKE